VKQVETVRGGIKKNSLLRREEKRGKKIRSGKGSPAGEQSLTSRTKNLNLIEKEKGKAENAGEATSEAKTKDRKG